MVGPRPVGDRIRVSSSSAGCDDTVVGVSVRWSGPIIAGERRECIGIALFCAGRCAVVTGLPPLPLWIRHGECAAADAGGGQISACAGRMTCGDGDRRAFRPARAGAAICPFVVMAAKRWWPGGARGPKFTPASDGGIPPRGVIHRISELGGRDFLRGALSTRTARFPAVHRRERRVCCERGACDGARQCRHRGELRRNRQRGADGELPARLYGAPVRP